MFSAHRRQGWPVALAVALSIAGFAVPARAEAASLPASAKPSKTVKLDIDGDGRKDTIRFYDEETTTLVKVTTAKKKTSTKRTDAGEMGNGFYAAAKLDGAKGYELIFIVDTEYITQYEVMTWRKGKLVKAAVPYALDSSDKRVGWSPSDDDQYSGFRFFTSKGKSYVDATALWYEDEDEVWEGRTFRSVWRDGRWVRQTVKDRDGLTEAQARAFSGFHGVKLVKK